MATAKEKAAIKKLFDTVQIKKAELESAEKGTYATDGIFYYSHSGTPHDIKTIRDKSKLRDMVAFLIEKEKSVDEANQFLEMTGPFKWFHATTEQWKKDIKVRVTQLDIITKKSELAEMEATLLTMDPDILKDLKMQEMTKKLGL